MLLADALQRAAALTDPRALLWAADAASISKGLGAGLPYVNRAVDLARRNGLLSLLPLALRRQAAEFLSLSQFDLAYAAAQEGYRLSLDLGYGSGGHLVNMAAVEAMRGHEQDARRHAAEALALAEQRGSWYPAIITEWTLGLIDLAAGRPAEAAGRLLAITGAEYPDRNPVVALEAMPDAVEAGVRAGLREQAAARLETFRGLVTAAPAPPRLALLARCDALLEARDPDEAFGEAIALSPICERSSPSSASPPAPNSCAMACPSPVPPEHARPASPGPRTGEITDATDGIVPGSWGHANQHRQLRRRHTPDAGHHH